MHWTDPPTRREFTLVLFAITVFLVSYNLDTSLHLLGIDSTSQTSVLGNFGLGQESAIDKDGRKLSVWRDAMENEVFGEWAWEEGHVAGDGEERSQGKNVGSYGAMWKDLAGINVTTGATDSTSDEPLLRWWQAPTANILKHVPGFTILENLILFNGNVYLVADDPTSMPSLLNINSRHSQEGKEWKVITTDEASKIIPRYGGRIEGVTWISTDAEPRDSTLLSLWRTYTSLDSSIDTFGRTILPPPRRLFFPYITTFSDSRPDGANSNYLARVRSTTGFAPDHAKLAFPTLGLQFTEDWNDYLTMDVPFIIQRAVIADHSSARMVLEAEQPAFLQLYQLNNSAYWLEPVRRALATFLDTYEDPTTKSSGRPVVTYLHRQDSPSGLRLTHESHRALIDELAKVGKSQGYDFEVISSTDAWGHKMVSVTKATIVVGVHGSQLLDAVYMRPSSHSAVMEFFPTGKFSRDNELPAKAVGLKYSAWWNERKFDQHLPAPLVPTDEEFSVDAVAVGKAIRQALSQR